MTVTIVTRWTTPDVAASTKVAKTSKVLWVKHGALDVRLNQVFTGPFTGQWLVATSFPNMAAYANAQAAVVGSAEMKKIQAENAKPGAVRHERTILVGTDL